MTFEQLLQLGLDAMSDPKVIIVSFELEPDDFMELMSTPEALQKFLMRERQVTFNGTPINMRRGQPSGCVTRRIGEYTREQWHALIDEVVAEERDRRLMVELEKRHAK